MHKQISLVFIFLTTTFLVAQHTTNPLLAEDAVAQQKWVDSVYNSLSLNEKIAQLYMVQVFSNGEGPSKNDVLSKIVLSLIVVIDC